MTNAKKKTIAFLSIAILLIVFFVVTLIGTTLNIKGEIAGAATQNEADVIENQINSIKSNGYVPEGERITSNNANALGYSTAIGSADALKNFLENGSGKGYLTGGISNFSWDDGAFTNRLISSGVTELNGNGYTITLNAYKLATSNVKGLGVTGEDDNPNTNWAVGRKYLHNSAKGTYVGDDMAWTRNNIDIHGGLIGYLGQNQTIRNCNFIYTGNVSQNYDSNNSQTFGLVVGYSVGNIDNCSLTINANSGTALARRGTYKGSASKNYGQEAMSRHSFAMGGFAGTMSDNATISNSKLVHQGTLSATVDPYANGGGIGSDYKHGYGRVWVGGFVGWIANGARVYNVTAEGNGDLNARCTTETGRSRSFAGIVAAVSGGDKTSGEDSVSGFIAACGRIDGVINKWTGKAKYLVGDTKYSPSNIADNTQQYLVVGLAGISGETYNVADIYTKSSIYSGNNYTVSYDYSTGGARQNASVIVVNDVLGLMDGSTSYKVADEHNTRLIFSGTEAKSPLWATYDLNDADCILWSKEVSDGVNQPTKQYYYDKATSKEDANRFDLTYTAITRGRDRNYTINYTTGRAVYFKKTYPSGSDLTNSSRVVLPDAMYGGTFENPAINVYADAACTSNHLQDFYDSTYWYYVSENNSMPRQLDKTQKLARGTYEMFIYVASPEGRDYGYIHFINETLRYVAYIKDDANFIKYKETHPDFEPVDKDGVKQINWQQRAVQYVKAKTTSVNWGKSDDVQQTSGKIEYDKITNKPICYGRYETVYDGDPVTFNLTINSGDILGGDTCGVQYEYQELKSSGVYETVDSCVNAGDYKLLVTGLNNDNYSIPQLAESDANYCINFKINQRQIMIEDHSGAILQDDGKAYVLKRPYQAANVDIAKDVAVCFDKSEAKPLRASIIFYNILDIDSNILKFDYVAVDGGDLDTLNVGKFDMVVSMVSGIKASNYILPESALYHIEIVEANARFENTDDISYVYGNFFADAQQPSVYGVGSDGKLSFTGYKFYSKVDGDYDMENPSASSPRDAGEYKVGFEFSYPNYVSETLFVNLLITPREVDVNLHGVIHDEFTYGEKTVKVVSTMELARQKGGFNTGILISEYSAIKDNRPTFKFELLDSNDVPSGIFVDEVVDVGRYVVHAGVDFTPGNYGGRVVDENTKYNYVVRETDYIIEVFKKSVEIELNDVERVYGSAEHQFIGEASSANKSWRYKDPSVTFLADDGMVIMPYLSNNEIYAPVQKNVSDADRYKVLAGLDNCSGAVTVITDEGGNEVYRFNKVDNYVITIESAVYTVLPKKIQVRVDLNTDNVVYGYDLPIAAVSVVGEDFFAHDNIAIDADYSDGQNAIVVGSKVGDYSIGAKFVSGNSDNYEFDVVKSGDFKILPRTLTIVEAHIRGDQEEYTFDGTAKTPDVEFIYEGTTFNNEKIDFIYNYFEVRNGVEDTVPTAGPTYAGTYRVYLSDVASQNYTVAYGENYVRGSVTLTINKREVAIEVKPGYRIYSIKDSLTPIVRSVEEGGGIHEDDPDWHYWTRDEAIANGKGDILLKPYVYRDGDSTAAENMFVQNNEQLGAQMYIDEYYSELGRRNGVIKLSFSGLVPDPNLVDEDGEWTDEPEVVDGYMVDNRYRNYTITMKLGDLHVLGADLANIKQYVNLRNSEEVYNGSDQYENFRVETTNENIEKALKFRVFRYVDVSTLPSQEGNALAQAYGKYSRTDDGDGKFVYTLDNTNGTFVRKYIKRVEYGDSVDEQLTEAGQYFKHITPAGEGIFTGEYITPFYITKAEREISDIRVRAAVYFNRIVLSCDVEGMIVSINDAAYVSRTTFENLTADTEYTIKVKFKEAANYLETKEPIVLKLRTGIDISMVADTINKLDRIDFNNVEEFETKVLMFMDRIAPEDFSLIDVSKYAKLQASYEQLLNGANSVIMGAQKVGARAVGKSTDTAARTAAASVALSTGGLGMLFAVGMIAGKKKKEEREDARRSAKSNVKRASKIALIVITLLLVCVLALTACDDTKKGFTKYDLYDIASYQDGTSSNKDLFIEVKAGSVLLYKLENGIETKHDKVQAPDISLGSNGKGFEFDDLYFSNAEFKDENGTATFNADIRETNVFLGVENAKNGKVNVSVNSESKTLNSIEVSYEIVNAGVTYSVVVRVS